MKNPTLFTAGSILATLAACVATTCVVLPFSTAGRTSWGEAGPVIVISGFVFFLAVVLRVVGSRSSACQEEDPRAHNRRPEWVGLAVCLLVAVWGVGFGGLTTADSIVSRVQRARFINYSWTKVGRAKESLSEILSLPGASESDREWARNVLADAIKDFDREVDARNELIVGLVLGIVVFLNGCLCAAKFVQLLLRRRVVLGATRPKQRTPMQRVVGT